MRTQFSKFALVAGFSLALAFTFSCTGNDSDNSEQSSSSGTPESSSSRSSSSGGTSLIVSSSSSLARSSSSSLQSSSSKNVIVYGKPINDTRDGQTYETVVIGKQTWMAKNLNFKTEDSKCYGEGTRMFSADSIAKNCEKFGRLYSWATAMSACPEGWHIPYYTEWEQLINDVGTLGTDDHGFSALLGGAYYDSYDSRDNFISIYNTGYWWSASELNVDVVYIIETPDKISIGLKSSSSMLFSVRCVQGPLGCTPENNTDTKYCLGMSGTMKEYGSMTDKGGKKYKTVEIGKQTWMAENLDYEVEYSKCYDNKPENCEKYGRLYDWLAATDVCPNGWHLPSKAEFSYLESLNSYHLWARNRSEVGTDNYGFSALGGGYGKSNGSFDYIGYFDFWWSSTEYNASNAVYLGDGMLQMSATDKTNFFSVRCIKD